MGENKRIGLREVNALQPGKILWDSAIGGFGARRQTDKVSYLLKYRTAEGRQRWQTIGTHGSPWTPETARKEALRLLGEVTKGSDPAAEKVTAREALSVAELCNQYLTDAEAGRILARGGRSKKASTVAADQGRINGHIIPLLGKLAVRAVTKQDVERMMHAIASGQTAKTTKGKARAVSRITGGKGVATRTIGLLGAIFTYAVDRRLRSDNPAHRIRKFAENKKERRLSDAEYALLGNGLRLAEGQVWAPAVAALRFLSLTGWRSGEAIGLRWRDIDMARRTATLPDTKTGKSLRPLSNSACDLLASLPRGNDDALVFMPSKGATVMSGFKKFARRIIAMAELPADITPHVLRHSFASLAADLEYGESTIGALIGHKSQSITGRYVHAADAVMLAAADAVARRTCELMGEAMQSAEIVPMKRA